MHLSRKGRFLFLPTVLAVLLWSGGALLAEGARPRGSQSYTQNARLPQSLNSAWQQLVKDEWRNKISVSVGDPATGRIVWSKSGDVVRTPASVLKLFTSLAAFRYLGHDYRYSTRVYGDRQPDARGAVGNLYFRGVGDPSLVTEKLSQLIADLRNKGVRSVNDVHVDDSAFIDPPMATGLDPYKAGLSAAAFNHNALEVLVGVRSGKPVVKLGVEGSFDVENRVSIGRVSAIQIEILSARDRAGRASAGSRLERYTTPGKVIVSGTVRKNVSDKNPLSLYQALDDVDLYLGFALRAMLREQGIAVAGGVVSGAIPKKAELLHVFYSKPLSEIVGDMNRVSSNFIAGQLVFALGKDGDRYRFEDGLMALKNTASDAGIATAPLEFVDGSGLERGNKLTTNALAELLIWGYGDSELSPTFVRSLSRFGMSGTLKGRHLKGDGAGDVWAKTGSLDGVSSLAGYAPVKGGRTVAFSIISSGLSKGEAVRIENGIVNTLLDSQL